MNGQSSLRHIGSPWAERFGAMAVFAILVSRAMESYAGSWLVGIAGLLLVLVRGSFYERLMLLFLFFLSLYLGGEQTYFGIRQMLFIALFILLSRYVPVRPQQALLFYGLGLVIYLVRTGELSPLFTVGPSVILLLVASYIIHRDEQASGKQRGSGWKVGLLSLGSLVLPFLGPGSRSALLVWASFSVRRISVALIVAGMIGVVFITTIPELEVLERIQNSYSELTDPFPEVGINLRAVEGLIFLSWWQTATTAEVLLGSRELIYMPGDFLGYLDDPAYVPHNQLIGLIFQFGFIGFGLILLYLVSYWRRLRAFPLGRFVMLVYLLLAFIVVHGFVNHDVAIAASVLLFYLRRLDQPKPTGAPEPTMPPPPRAALGSA